MCVVVVVVLFHERGNPFSQGSVGGGGGCGCCKDGDRKVFDYVRLVYCIEWLGTSVMTLLVRTSAHFKVIQTFQ